MAKIKVIKTKIDGLVIIEPSVFGDHRGYFMETYNEEEFHQAGLTMRFVQDNESKSSKGVLRGLHFQTKFSQGKLVRATKGEVYDVAVDLRNGSPTYGQWAGVLLTEENKTMFYIPEGFAHGFMVVSEEAVFNYKCTNLYAPEYDGGIRWNDPEVGIEWPLDKIDDVLLSEKDEKLPFLNEISDSLRFE
ncbi:dTDP-4-dehydrorhamnose 3,5-epimerase [Acetobacterium woodii]|uniref:dTDP-4-dehydrorhamnose 3,5-epimerase n=1 Tax=Acetobacterium woodii (strain ATCC 29683 / DSM 1030 / JCM 2381 / KCTC 1655 / WB1) TaxID=931626 RepID=H6LGA4_ACEWD|nr:dTDP-4-dehydrorhamnose 3,5-epimerase [Acetobacterium woodii]AFA47040.1 dTDP-4-dehydrorhamnose 3,5-epimerase RfbC [Acetobacterium woodii DSM 1030]